MFNEIHINKYNLINNIKQVIKNNPRSKICAMVKANAYGVGLKQVVEILNSYVDYFGVACFFEAEQVAVYSKKDILIVGALEKQCIDERFCYTCSDLEDVEYLISSNKKIRVHLKINTGMNRFGFKSIAEVRKVLKLIKNSRLILEGVFTHFATTDNFINIQMNRFIKFVQVVKKYKKDIIVHADNSAVNEIKNHNLDMVRIGFNLYNNNQNNFKPVVTIKSKIVQINNIKKNECVGYSNRFIANKKMKIAIVPIGYADGFGLEFIGMEILVNFSSCKVLNVCMDCLMLDVTNLKLKKGDNIYILNNLNSLLTYAAYSKLSEYQIMTNFSNMRAIRIVDNNF